MPESWEKKIIEAGYRELAKRCHPDHGGSHSQMSELNQAVERLRLLMDAPARQAPRIVPFDYDPRPPARTETAASARRRRYPERVVRGAMAQALQDFLENFFK